jgi:hypothetical protein
MTFGLGVWLFSSGSGLTQLQADEPGQFGVAGEVQPAAIEAQPLADQAAVDQAAVLKEQGIEALDKGPVHEAFAQPTPKNPEPGPIIRKQPPRPIEELPPEQKPEGDNVQWIKGYWAWDAERNDFIWVSGFWRLPPPDRQWVAGTWTQAADGWQWVPGYWASAQQDVQSNLPPPPESLDYGPTVPAPSEDAFYVPGNWAYTNHYIWQPGYWSFYRPGFIWNPASYYWTPDGYTFVNGYWDFPWWNRGLLFAPVWFHRPLFWNTGFFFRPFFAVNTPFLNAFFFRPGFNHFWFGRFGDPFFHRSGFQVASFNRVNNSIHVTNINNVNNINNLANVRARTGSSVIAPVSRMAANTRLGGGVTTTGGVTRLNTASGRPSAAVSGAVSRGSSFAQSRSPVTAAARGSNSPRITAPAPSSRVTGPSRGSASLSAPGHTVTHGSQSHAVRTAPGASNAARTAPAPHVSHYSAPSAAHVSGPAFHNPAPSHFSSGGHSSGVSHFSGGGGHVSGAAHTSGGGHAGGGGGHPAGGGGHGGGHGHR